MSELQAVLMKAGTMLDQLDFRASPELAEHRARRLMRIRRELNAEIEALRSPNAIPTRFENILLKGIV